MKKVSLYVLAAILGLAVVVGVGGGTAYLVYKQMKPAEAATAAADLLLTPGSSFALDPFTTHLADTDRPRYINVTFALVADEKVVPKLEENVPLLRDTILGLLNQTRAADVTGEAGAANLKTAVQERVNNVLGGKVIQHVLVTEFVVQ